MDKKEYYLRIAKEVAARSTCIRKQYGAVIVKNDEIIATGYNGSPRGAVNCSDINTCAKGDGPNYERCRAVHAEQNAIICASRQEMEGSTLFLACVKDGIEITDIEPCTICKRMIRNAGIKQITMRKGNLFI